MKIDQPGLFLQVDPIRITAAANIGGELRVLDYPLTLDQAASLGTTLLALSAMERQASSVEAEQIRDAEFLRNAGVRLQ